MSAFFILLISFLTSGEMTPEEEITSETSAIAAEIKKNQQTEDMTTYYFIRHAEKVEKDPQNKDPFLTKAGLERAEKWAEIFREIEFDLIFSTDFNRTRKTAETIADTQEKPVTIYDARKENDPEFQEKTKGKTVLVVGHSNTNPAFVNSILQEEKHLALDEKEYGSVFIVHVAPDGTRNSQVMYIN